MLCSLTLHKLLAYSQYTPHAADMFVAVELTAVTFDFDIGDVCLWRALKERKKKTSSQRDGIHLNISYLGIMEPEDSSPFSQKQFFEHIFLLS